MFSISFHNFLLYLPNLITIKLGFLPYFSYLFTIQLTFLSYFPYIFTIQLTFLLYFPNLFTIQLGFLPYFPYHFTIQPIFLPLILCFKILLWFKFILNNTHCSKNILCSPAIWKEYWAMFSSYQKQALTVMISPLCTNCHDITVILLNVALSTINLALY
jgi:hypothetical protein